MSESVQFETQVWTPSDATFGARLALIRQHMAWGNVKEAAFTCGIPVQSWRAWERDGGHPRNYIEVCAKIAGASGCDYGWLVDRRPSGSNIPTQPYLVAKLASSTDNPARTDRRRGHLTAVPSR